MEQNFNSQNIRVKEANFGRIFCNKAIRFLMALLAIMLIIGGVAVIYFYKTALGWLLMGLSAPLIMLSFWAKYVLTNVPIQENFGINGVLSTECLRLLGKNPSAKTIANIIPKTSSGGFMLIRAEIHPSVLTQIIERIGDDPTPIFNKALEIRKRTNSKEVNGAVLAVSIIESFPDHEAFLNHIKLELSDLYQCIAWYNNLEKSVEFHNQPKRTGGIGRDYSFGFTPLLQHFAVNISMQTNSHTNLPRGSRSDIVDKIIQIFSNNGRQNIALVGPLGSGRTTLIHAFAERLLDANSKIPNNLKFRQVFFLDAISLIGAVGERGDLENLVTQLIEEAYSAKNVILCLDNAHLFFENGTGSVDISQVILPYLEAGRQRMILIMDEQRYLEISTKNPALANSLNKIMVPPTDEQDTLYVLQDQAPFIEYQHKITFSYRALLEAYRLSQRYIYDIEMPGKAMKLIEAAANYAENGMVSTESIQKTIEQTQGIKVGTSTTTNDNDRNKLLNLESLIHERMIDQAEAVSAVSNALRRAVAGVRNEQRPIGTFLFLGPTGVGKTELAKAISETYFDGEKHIIRIDLNEYVTANDVQKLIADGVNNDMSLTAQAMKHPFSVILLDEIEKAHPQVLTTLLQLLDEGVLRDESNHEVSFRDTIVIATSNAGANEIREHITKGQDISTLKDSLIDELINSGQFRPEFLNRFDEICLFKPLGKEELKQILALIIKSVNQTLAPQKISVVLDDSATELLVERGYDPRMGARPMRRIVQKTVENIVAKSVLSGAVNAGEQITITGAQVAEELNNSGV